MAGFSRGWADRIISFFTDLFLSFPFLLGMLALAPIITSRFTDQDTLKWAQLVALISVLIIFGWMGLTRLIRGQVLSLREREFILAAEVIGVPTRQILFKELLPNLIAPDRGVDLARPAGVRGRRGRAVVPRPRPDRDPLARQDGLGRDAVLRRLPAVPLDAGRPSSRC